MTSPLVLAGGFSADIASPIIQGVFQGAIYGLIGLGLVLLYKSNRIFNFAQGEFGSVAALVAYAGISGKFGVHLPYVLACILGVAAGTLTAVATERFVVRPLFARPKVILLVGTVGVALLLIALETALLPSAQNPVPPVNEGLGLTRNGRAFSAFGYLVQYQDLFVLAVLVVLALLTVAFFTRTDTGTAILAVAQEPTAASVVGISVSRVSLITWGLAGFLGSVAGILLAGTVGNAAPGLVTGTGLFTGFAAAVLGGITSLPGAFLGGIIIGVIEKLAGANSANLGNIQGLDGVAVFAALLIVLLVRPKGLLGKEI